MSSRQYFNSIPASGFSSCALRSSLPTYPSSFRSHQFSNSVFSSTCSTIQMAQPEYRPHPSLVLLRRELWSTPWYEDHHIMASAPWFSPRGCDDDDVLRYCANAGGELPGRLPIAAIKTFEWRKRCAVNTPDLAPIRRRWYHGSWGRETTRGDPWRDHIHWVMDKPNNMTAM